jgi:DNA-binding transcriptional ArsR family regulator
MLLSSNMSVDQLDGVFRALADPSRRRILDLLKKKPRTTGELAAEFGEIGRCAVMKHLDILNQAELVLFRREGRYRLNYINPVPIRRIYERWMYPLVESKAANMISLKNHIEAKIKKEKRK